MSKTTVSTVSKVPINVVNLDYLVQTLDQAFSQMTITPSKTTEEIMFNAGQRDVIRYIKEYADTQRSDIFEGIHE